MAGLSDALCAANSYDDRVGYRRRDILLGMSCDDDSGARVLGLQVCARQEQHADRGDHPGQQVCDDIIECAQKQIDDDRQQVAHKQQVCRRAAAENSRQRN